MRIEAIRKRPWATLIGATVALLVCAAALVALPRTTSGAIAWICIGVIAAGCTVLIVDAALRLRGVPSDPGGPHGRDPAAVPQSDARAFAGEHIPDYSATDPPAADAPVHDDHEIERDLLRHNEVLPQPKTSD